VKSGITPSILNVSNSEALRSLIERVPEERKEKAFYVGGWTMAFTLIEWVDFYDALVKKRPIPTANAENIIKFIVNDLLSCFASSSASSPTALRTFLSSYDFLYRTGYSASNNCWIDEFYLLNSSIIEFVSLQQLK
jgi:hypothetical protein